MTDPDLEGPKTPGSGSTTLFLFCRFYFTYMFTQESVKEEHHSGMAMFLLNKYIAMLHVARQDFLKGNLRRMVAPVGGGGG
jgi:hypothetical protein